MFSVGRLRKGVRQRDNSFSISIFNTRKVLRGFNIPVIYGVHKPLYEIRELTFWLWHEAWRILWITPLFQSRLVRPAPHLHIRGRMPYLSGNLETEIGANCNLSGASAFIGRSASYVTPRLRIGSNYVIGYKTTIAVGRNVEIGDNVLLSAGLFLAGYPGPPWILLNAQEEPPIPTIKLVTSLLKTAPG